VSTAIVTGGSAGIGLAVVTQLLEKNHEVISLDVQPTELKHPKLSHVKVDLTDTAATAHVAKEINRKAITTLIHNAGAIRPALLPDVKLEDLHALVNLHLAAAVVLMQAMLPAMKQGEVRPGGARFLARCSACRRGPLLLGDQGRHARHGPHTWAQELRPPGVCGRRGAAPGRSALPISIVWFPRAAHGWRSTRRRSR
jgi:NAD(P)-dependent dehydrogenase (short-subunit alcohol dehydrogenase family)